VSISLTLLVLTGNHAHRLARVLPELAGAGDELVVAIDDSSTDDTEAVARSFTDRVCFIPHGLFWRRSTYGGSNPLESISRLCTGDWILRIDDDETLSPRWKDPVFRQRLLDDRYATHLWVPRRWAVPHGRYIANRHWFPDFQLRGFRNIPSLIRLNERVHEPIGVAGEARYLPDAWLVHWDLVWHDRATREAKVQSYRALGGYAGADYYLYEQQAFETLPLEYEFPALTPSAREARGGPFGAHLESLETPRRMTVGETRAYPVAIHNGGDRTLWPASPGIYPANAAVAYHWYVPRSDGEHVYLWDAPRTELPARIPPGESAGCLLTVKAPDEPDTYLWQPDLVEEDVAWFSSRGEFPQYVIDVHAPETAVSL
jgi:hypothetical protein